jgi:hypothetical protein
VWKEADSRAPYIGRKEEWKERPRRWGKGSVAGGHKCPVGSVEPWSGGFGKERGRGGSAGAFMAHLWREGKRRGAPGTSAARHDHGGDGGAGGRGRPR